MTNGRYIDIENEVLRNHLRDLKAAAVTLCEAVERYVVPRKGDAYCFRMELLRKKDDLRAVLEGKPLTPRP